MSDVAEVVTITHINRFEFEIYVVAEFSKRTLRKDEILDIIDFIWSRLETDNCIAESIVTYIVLYSEWLDDEDDDYPEDMKRETFMLDAEASIESVYRKYAERVSPEEELSIIMFAEFLYSYLNSETILDEEDFFRLIDIRKSGERFSFEFLY